MTTTAKKTAHLYRVEGGIDGSMHHRGPWWYATEEEAAAKCGGDRYPDKHPACSDIGMAWTAVPLPAWVLPALRSLVGFEIRLDGDETGEQWWTLPEGVTEDHLQELRSWWLVEDYECDSPPYHRPGLSGLATRLLTAE